MRGRTEPDDKMGRVIDGFSVIYGPQNGQQNNAAAGIVVCQYTGFECRVSKDQPGCGRVDFVTAAGSGGGSGMSTGICLLFRTGSGAI